MKEFQNNIYNLCIITDLSKLVPQNCDVEQIVSKKFHSLVVTKGTHPGVGLSCSGLVASSELIHR